MQAIRPLQGTWSSAVGLGFNKAPHIARYRGFRPEQNQYVLITSCSTVGIPFVLNCTI